MSPRPLALLSLAVVTPVGFALKLAGTIATPLGSYAANSLAGVAYEIFWCLVVFVVVPRRRAIIPICVGVFIVTTLLEFLQLWQPAPPNPLATARSHFLGRTLLGTTFSWLDIPHYALGCALACIWLRTIVRAPRQQHQAAP